MNSVGVKVRGTPLEVNQAPAEAFSTDGEHPFAFGTLHPEFSSAKVGECDEKIRFIPEVVRVSMGQGSAVAKDLEAREAGLRGDGGNEGADELARGRKLVSAAAHPTNSPMYIGPTSKERTPAALQHAAVHGLNREPTEEMAQVGSGDTAAPQARRSQGFGIPSTPA